jgi:hypothetical protein
MKAYYRIERSRWGATFHVHCPDLPEGIQDGYLTCDWNELCHGDLDYLSDDGEFNAVMSVCKLLGVENPEIFPDDDGRYCDPDEYAEDFGRILETEN